MSHFISQLHGLFRSPAPPILVVEHTAIIYLCLIMGLRLIGRRSMGQLTVVDLVVTILIGSAVETSMVAGKGDQPNTSLIAGLLAASTLFVLNRLVTWGLMRIKRLRHAVLGEPTLLVNDGQFIEEHLRREGLTEADVLEALRERGEEGLENVKFAVLEIDGTIHVVSNPAKTHRSQRNIAARERRVPLTHPEPGS